MAAAAVSGCGPFRDHGPVEVPLLTGRSRAVRARSIVVPSSCCSRHVDHGLVAVMMRSKGRGTARAARPLGPDVDGHPVSLGVVADEVLDCRRRSVPLQPSTYAAPILVVSTGPRSRTRSAGRPGAACRLTVGASSTSMPLLGTRRPRRVATRSTSAGSQGCGARLVTGGGRQVALVPALAAHPDRAVGHHHLAQPDLRQRVRAPEGLAVSSLTFASRSSGPAAAAVPAPLPPRTGSFLPRDLSGARRAERRLVPGDRRVPGPGP